MSWLQLSVAVSRDCADTVTDVLNAGGAVAVTLAGAGADELLEPDPGEQPLWERLRLLALLPPDADLKALRAHLEPLGAALDDVTFVAAENWQARWRAHAVRACFGGRLWLLPRDEPFDAPAGAALLRLDPGLAFGSGSHPTTRLCLAALAALPLDGATVLDYGCGSGILAVAAALLGAARVVAVDHDPQALVATRDNAAFNRLRADGLTVLPPEELTGTALPEAGFDVVVANILANPLVTLAPRLSALTRPGGRVLLSGLLAEQATRVARAYPDVAFAAPVREDGWVRLDGRRERPP